MFSYYGSKASLVGIYPPPKEKMIVEPFAGSAQYALKYWDREVWINDKYDVVFRIWQHLQKCSPKDILSLPEPRVGQYIKLEDFDCQEMLWLMGYMIGVGSRGPRFKVSPFADGSIRPKKKIIAENLFKIKHWKITNMDYGDMENVTATWYVDPPYQVKGYGYIHSSKSIDFEHLGQWCRQRNGQTIVCENEGANWLPFKKLINFRGATQKNVEVIWSNHPTAFDHEQITLF